MISFAVTETKCFCAIAKLNKGEGASYSSPIQARLACLRAFRK